MTTTNAPAPRRHPLASLGLFLALALPRLLAVSAFPGAEGFGANATGGRGGTVYHVTNLNDSGTGSFRDAVSAGGRTVVFDVGGVIRLASDIAVSSNVTIAGQTAPGEGICLYGRSLSLSSRTNIIVRYLRIRQGIAGDSGSKALGMDNASNLIVDHCSIQWGRWDVLGITNNAHDITVQYCIMAEGINPQSFGALIDSVTNVTLSHNLWMSNESRNPKAKGTIQYINNVVYNWGGTGLCGGHSAGDHFLDVIGNYFIEGPSSNNRLAGQFLATDHVYQSGNFADLDTDGTLNGQLIGEADFHRADESGYTLPTFEATAAMHPAIPVTIDSAAVAYQRIVAEAGCSLSRDSVDQRLITELTSLGLQGQTIPHADPRGEALVGGQGDVAGGLAAVDTDNDGLPDFWESAAGTNALLADNNGDLDGDGFSNLENYVNAIASAGGPSATIDGLAGDTSGTTLYHGITYTAHPGIELRGASAPTATVALSRVDTGVIGSTTADGSGAWVFDYTGTLLTDRAYAFQAVVGASAPSIAFVVQVKTTPATAPAITSVVTSPAFAINGTSDPANHIDVTLAGTGVVGSATADDLGNWSAPYTGAPLPPGTYTFTAAATDLAGNRGPASAPYAADTALAAPVFTGIVSDSGASATDQITNDPTLVLNGTSFASATVSITRLGVGVIGSATADASGAWSFNYTGTTLPAGTYQFTATASDGSNASPSSSAFVVTIDTTRPTVSSIKRQDPTTSATTASTVVFRVTFAEPVSGVDAGDFSLTLGAGVTGAIASLVPVDSTAYDVTVTGVTGDSTVRLDAKSSGTGIVDVAGNALNTGFTSGQTYTIRLPGSGVWTSTDNNQRWSNPANWDDAIVADGAGATADFTNFSEDVTVQLDSARTLGRLVFGDPGVTDPALWTLGNNGSPANVLTLAGPTPNLHVNAVVTSGGDTVDVPAAADFPTTLDVVLAGSGGFTKTGVGTLQITQPATITGPLTITKGVVQIGPGGSLTPSSVSISTSQQLRVAGGTFTTPGNVTWNSGTGTGIIVSAGTGDFQRILPSNTRNSFVRVTGGTFSATEIKFPRSGDSESQALAAGVQISGGDSTVGTIGLGTDNSWGAMTISGGRLTVTGPVHVGFQVTSARGGDVAVSGGEFDALDASPTGGLILARNPATDSPARANNTNQIAKFTITGGVSNIARLALGYDASSSAGSVTVAVTDGELNLGTGGIVKNGTMASSITLNSGTLGAFAPWSTSQPIVLNGTPAALALRAANASGDPFDFALTGPLTGPGGFDKTGAGTLTLAGANTFAGSVAIDAGTLLVTGSLAAGGEVDINPGGTLAGGGAIGKAIVLNGGTLAPTGTAPAAAVTWNAGSLLAIRLGASGSSDQLALGGPLTKGAAGSYVVALAAGSGFAAGNTYTIATFASTDFAANDFTAVGLPSGYQAFFTLTGTSLQVTVKAVAGLTLGNLQQAYDGTPKSVTAATAPAGLAVTLTYDGSSTPPTLPGSYAVIATIDDPSSSGTASATLTISATALVRHAPTLNGDIDGSVQMLLPESTTLNGNAMVSGDLLVPGSPAVQLNGHPTYGSTLDGSGSASPANYTITLNGGSVLRHVVRRVDPIAMPAVAAPPPPAGTRNVALNSPGQSPGDFATLRNLTLNGNAGAIAVPPGSYGSFIANGNGSFVLGIAGATEPAVYNLQALTLNGTAQLQIVGPVVLTLASGTNLNGSVGSSPHPEWLTLQLAAGGLTLNGNVSFSGVVIAPGGTVVVNGSSTLHGHVTADRLPINGNGLLEEPAP